MKHHTPTPPKKTHTRGKMNVGILKIIMSENKIILPSLKNQNWKTAKIETEKLNEYISQRTIHRNKQTTFEPI